MSSHPTRILVIDNYDSFVYNLVQYLGQLGAECIVQRNDAIAVSEALSGEIAGSQIDGILLSPGPATPERAGICVELIREAARRYRAEGDHGAGDSVGVGVGGARHRWVVPPILGVCLGHQAFGVAFGATVGRAEELLHGKTSEVAHNSAGILCGLPNPLTATRYHSLAVAPETVPSSEIEVTGSTTSGVIMAMRHRQFPIEGVQFHPESVLTQAGHQLLANWLTQCGDNNAAGLAPSLVEATELQRTGAYQLA